MVAKILIVLLCFLGPLGIMWLTYHSRVLRQLGDIIIAYTIGIALALSGVVQSTDPEIRALLTVVAEVSIPFAIPLMLLSADVKAWLRLAPSFLKSTACAVVGCVLAIVVGYVLYGQSDPVNNAKVGGMLTGLYTGGTANQASLMVALDVPQDVYLMSHACSLGVSVIYVIVVVFCGKRLFGLVLPPFDKQMAVSDGDDAITLSDHSKELFYGLLYRSNIPNLLMALWLTIVIIGLGAGVAVLVKFLTGADVFLSVFIMTITLLSVLAAQNRKVRSLPRTYETGNYFILVFSLAVSMQVSTNILSSASGDFLAFVTVATLGALFLHVLFSALLRVDTDTTLATSISLICSPPFVPVVASQIGNKAIVGPGIAVGLFGYAVGTYLGFAVAKLLGLLC